MTMPSSFFICFSGVQLQKFNQTPLKYACPYRFCLNVIYDTFTEKIYALELQVICF